MPSELRRFYRDLTTCEFDELGDVIDKYLGDGGIKKLDISGSLFDDGKTRVVAFDLKNIEKFECILFLPNDFKLLSGRSGFKKMMPIFERAGLL